MRDLKGNSLIDFPESYTVIDIETTGFDPSKDHIIEIAALKIDNNRIKDSFCSFVNVGVNLDPFITKLTGITDENLAGAPKLGEILPSFAEFVKDDIIVGHNVNFDINFLYDHFLLHLKIPFSNDYIDTLRLSKRYCKDAPSHKLSELASFLKLSTEEAHRALADCYTTNNLLIALKEIASSPTASEEILLSELHFDNNNPFYGKLLAVKGMPQYYSYSFMKTVADKCHAKLSDTFFSHCDYVIFSKYTHERYKRGEYSEKFVKANQLIEKGTLTVLSETEWCNLLHIPIPDYNNNSPHISLRAKNITTEQTDFDTTHPLYGKVCVFTGTLEKMTRKEAMQLVVDLGGIIGDSVTKKTNFLVLGNNDYCPSIKDGKSSKQKKAESLKLDGQNIDIISENVFYDMIEE